MYKNILLCFLICVVIIYGIFFLSILLVNKKTEHIENQLKNENLNWWIIGFIGLASIILIFSFISPILLTRGFIISEFDFSKTGQIGDTIGGIMNPFIAIVGVIVTGLAFYMQYRANKIQVNLFNQTQKEQSDFTKKQFFIKLIDNLHEKLINFTITNTAFTGVGGVLGVSSGFGGSTTSMAQGFNALDQIIRTIEDSFKKNLESLGNSFLDIDDNKIRRSLTNYINSEFTLTKMSKKDFELFISVILKMKNGGDRQAYIEKILKINKLNTSFNGYNIYCELCREIGLIHFADYGFNYKVTFYNEISKSLFSYYGSFLESYINSLNLIVKELLVNKTDVFYIDYFKNNVTNNEKMILYYCLISKRMPLTLKKQLLDLNFFDENLFTSGNKTFFEYEVHKSELTHLIEY